MNPEATTRVDSLLKKYSAPTGGATGAPSVDTEMDAIFNEVAPQAVRTTTATTVPEKKTVGGFVKNVGTSGADLIGGIVKALVNPVDTAKNVGGLAVGAGQKLVGYDGEQSLKVDALVDYYKQRYGKDLSKTLYEDPVGVLADLSTVLGGGGALLKGVGKIAELSDVAKVSGAAEKATRYGKILDRGATVTDPLAVGVRGAGLVSRETGLSDAATRAKDFTTKLFDKTEEATTPTVRGQAPKKKGVREKVEEVALNTGMDKQTQTILRQPLPGEKPAQTAARVQREAEKFYKAQEEHMAKGAEYDNAQQVLGSAIGNGYKQVLAKQQELGDMIGKARKEATTPVNLSAAKEFLDKELKSNGVIITPKGYKIEKGYTTKLTKAEIGELLGARKKLIKTSKNPSAENVSNLKELIAKDIDFGRPLGKTSPGADRIVRGMYDQMAEALNVKEAPDLRGIYAMNKEYERLSKLLEEGEGILGKKSPTTGEFRHDASLAKASVNSLHASNKIDFLKLLGKEVGENYIQQAAIAKQVMQDLGDFKQASLLEELVKGAGESSRTNSMLREGIDKAVETAVAKVVGEPKERTLRYIKKDAAKTTDTKTRGTAKEVPVKEAVVKNPSKIMQGLRQLGYTTKAGGSKIRTRNAVINEALGLDEGD